MPFTRLTDCGMDAADARALLTQTAAGQVWEAAAAELADAQLERAARAAAVGHVVTAREAAGNAVAAAVFAQMARNADDQVKRDLHAAQVLATHRLAELSGGLVERIEVPLENGRLVGWLCLPAARRADAAVVVWGGLSGWGPAYLPVAAALTRRGLACLLVEGPGQGESRLVHGVHADATLPGSFSRFVDVVLNDPRLGKKVGVQGNSFGGLFAALTASSDDRVAACVVNGAPSAPTVPEFRTAREQILALLGLGDVDQAEHVLRSLRFRPEERRISCPLLVLHGGSDPLVTRAEQQVFLAAADPARASLREWPDGEHTLYNHAAERNAFTADWFADQLLATR